MLSFPPEMRNHITSFLSESDRNNFYNSSKQLQSEFHYSKKASKLYDIIEEFVFDYKNLNVIQRLSEQLSKFIIKPKPKIWEDKKYHDNYEKFYKLYRYKRNDRYYACLKALEFTLNERQKNDIIAMKGILYTITQILSSFIDSMNKTIFIEFMNILNQTIEISTTNSMEKYKESIKHILLHMHNKISLEITNYMHENNISLYA